MFNKMYMNSEIISLNSLPVLYKHEKINVKNQRNHSQGTNYAAKIASQKFYRINSV